MSQTIRNTSLLAICGSLRHASSNKELLKAAALLAPPEVEVAVYGDLDQLPPFNPDLDIETPSMPVAALGRDCMRKASPRIRTWPRW